MLLRNISDLTYYVDYLFSGGPTPPSEGEADVDGNRELNISDLTYSVAYMFGGGPDPIDCL